MLASRKGRPQGPLQGRASKLAVASPPRCGREDIEKSAPAALSSNSQQGPKVADIFLPADDPLPDSKGEDHGKPADAASRPNPDLSRQQRYRQSDRYEKTGEGCASRGDRGGSERIGGEGHRRISVLVLSRYRACARRRPIKAFCPETR